MPLLDIRTLPDLLHRAALAYADSPALEHAQRADSVITFNELHTLSKRGAAALLAQDLKAGDKVLLTLEPGPSWPIAFFAIIEAGLVVVPVPAETPAPALAAISAHSGVRAVIRDDHAQEPSGMLDGLIPLSASSLIEFQGAPVSESSANPRELAMLAFTSGSVQQPRAVELTQDNLTNNLNGLLQVRSVEPGTAFLSILPPSHLFELMVGLLGPLACGARIVYAGCPLPNRIVDAIREREINHAPVVPALVSCLYDEVLDELIDGGYVGEERRRQSPTETVRRVESELTEEELKRIASGVRARLGSSLQTLLVGGASIDPNLIRVADAVGLGLEFGYGLTEASPLVSIGHGRDCPIGSVGRPLPNVEVRIDESGEILVRGPNVTRGYYGSPELTAESFADGWLRTGDRGRFDEDGFLFVTGRIKEAMVTAAGETIYPEEIEPWYDHPLFVERCVSRTVGPDGNDLPVLYVVPADPECPPSDIDAALAELRAAAPSHMRVSGVIRLNHPLPRTATGKVQRHRLPADPQSNPTLQGKASE